MGDALDRPVLGRAMRLYVEALSKHREELDSLNVYPVPDGDTGTNLLLTQTAVVSALAVLDQAGSAPNELEATISKASLMGARGNSGVILSQVLRGMVEAMPEDGSYRPEDLVDGLGRAADEAHRAVARPVEGTVLSVLRDAAAAAAAAGGSPDAGCRSVLSAVLDEARASLARTRDQLPELKRAGVVDAGGKGIVLLLAALLAAVSGEHSSEPIGPLGPVGARQQGGEVPEVAFDYEVQFLLQAPDESLALLRTDLGNTGDSLVVVGGKGLFNVHVHTNDPDGALQIGRRAGRLDGVSVGSLRDRVADCMAGQARGVRVAEQGCAMVAVAEGQGLTRAFRSLGAIVVTGGPGNNPGVADLVAAIEAAPADEVIVLPNHQDVVPTAEQAAGAASKRTVVTPTRSVPAGFAAATAFNPVRSLEENATTLKEGLDRAKAGALTQAARDAASTVGPVREGGRWLAMAEEKGVVVAGSAAEAAVALVRELLGPDHQVITVVHGLDAAPGDRRSVEDAVRRSFPAMRVDVLDGGQPRYPFLIGVE